VHSFGSVAVQNGFFDQEFRPQSPCVEIRPGDTITTTCNYDNGTGQTVVGGEATTQEMCMNFLIYFPRLPNPSDGYCGTIEGQ
jgi:hypothetical protein